ncbi:hypothetical protein [Hyphomicrobium sp. NDB2Meth4]|uniref:hypothetical protein n=1 Tax=Hyphomicrobium sp. NDB2Meth4 TaxID=1892846 RepID=UPI001FCCDE9B|nr:hypothetical protein [Hyphomicrobium sp. NDB2Meth4]
MSSVLSKLRGDARSELLGMEKRKDEIDREEKGDAAAEDKIEHRQPHSFAAQRA